MRLAQRRNGLILASALGLLGVLVLAHIIQVARARSEVRALTELVRPGDTPQQVSDLFRANAWGHLTLGTAVNGVIPVSSHPGWMPSQNWVVWISTVDGKATAVRVRLSDGTHWHPKGAPPDRVWGREPRGSYFVSP